MVALDGLTIYHCNESAGPIIKDDNATSVSPSEEPPGWNCRNCIRVFDGTRSCSRANEIAQQAFKRMQAVQGGDIHLPPG